MKDVGNFITTMAIIVIYSGVAVTCAVLEVVDHNMALVVLGISVLLLYRYLKNR